jgi:hypothetical protein
MAFHSGARLSSQLHINPVPAMDSYHASQQHHSPAGVLRRSQCGIMIRFPFTIDMTILFGLQV